MTAPARTPLAGTDQEFLTRLAAQLRVDSIRASTAAGSGHPTSGMSAADVVAVLLARHLRYDWDNPDAPGNDRLILSKGHASPVLYAMFKAAGVIDDAELVGTYRRADSRLQGHPTPVLPWVDVATGSLGQGLPIGVGVALAGRYLDKLPYRVWVLCGDSEMAEGSIWEALDKAAYYGLSNLTVIVDVNRLGQRGPTELEWDLDAYASRVAAFGCVPLPVEGHDVEAVDGVLASAEELDRPAVVLARTLKGRGFGEIEDAEDWHGKPLPAEMAERAIATLGGDQRVSVPRLGSRTGAAPASAAAAGGSPASGSPAGASAPVRLPEYQLGDRVPTRDAFGDALVALGERPRIVVLDGEVSDSTRAKKFAAAYPDRFFEMFIAEQQMVGAAVGLASRGYQPFAATFGAFFTRAYDFVRMAAISGADIRLAGSHAGVEIGADGPSQMALEDLAMMRAVNGSTVLYPADATSAAKLVQAMADTEGIAYLRTTRGGYPVLYGPDEDFPVGGSKLLRGGEDDQVALLAAGVTVHLCLEAADRLAERGIRARVIDLYSVKPIDAVRLREAVRDTGGRLVVVEDHYPAGGLGSAVAEVLASPPDGRAEPWRMEHLAVRSLPGSGSSQELFERAGISVDHIVAAATASAS
ncbi:MAG: transketolase [Streptosporangiales bacterium]|nr:transketolase [Streptosporangiales bacterium]